MKTLVDRKIITILIAIFLCYWGEAFGEELNFLGEDESLILENYFASNHFLSDTSYLDHVKAILQDLSFWGREELYNQYRNKDDVLLLMYGLLNAFPLTFALGSVLQRDFKRARLILGLSVVTYLVIVVVALTVPTLALAIAPLVILPPIIYGIIAPFRYEKEYNQRLKDIILPPSLEALY